MEQDWKTRNNYKLRSRYIETGIDNFVTGRYSPGMLRGCVLGYIVQGTASEIVLKINKLLAHRGREKELLKNRHCINDCPDCYQSKHMRYTDKKSIKLYHVLLTF